MVIPSATRKQTLISIVTLVGVLAIAIWALTRYISPAPPDKIAMTAGAIDGASHRLLNFKEKNRLYRRYGVLLDLERELRDRQLNAQEIVQAAAKLDQIEKDVSEMKFSLDFTDRIYTLRQHVDYVRVQLQKEKDGLGV